MWRATFDGGNRGVPGAVSRRGRMSRCPRVLGVGFMVLGFTLLGVVLVVIAQQLELRKRGHV